MKIVIMNTVPYGSTGRISYEIGERAEKKGHEVYIINGWTKKKREDKRVIAATSFFSKLYHLVMSKITGFDGCFSTMSTYLLIRKLEKIHPDLINLHIMHDFFLNLQVLFKYITKNKIKVVWTFHDCWTFTGGCPYYSISKCDKWMDGCTVCASAKAYDRLHLKAPRYMWSLKKKLAAYEDLCIVTPSEWLKKQVEASFWKDKKCKVIHNGLDLSVFKKEASDFKKKINCEDKYLVLGVAFGWGERKGLDVFNKLADILPEKYRIVLVGTTEEVDKQLNSKIISIHRTGSQKELVRIYSSADVFANPTREEVFGMVNIEAIACGTPVVSFNTDGAPEGINPDSGIIIPEKSAECLAENIVKVCENSEYDYEKMIRWVRNFEKDKNYDKYIKLFEDFYNGLLVE